MEALRKGCADQEEVSKLKDQINDKLNDGIVLNNAEYRAAKTLGINIKYKINYGLIREYLKDIEKRTGFKIHKSQMEELKKELRKKQFIRLTPQQTRKHRKKFKKSLKDKCIKEWEEKTSRE